MVNFTLYFCHYVGKLFVECCTEVVSNIICSIIHLAQNKMFCSRADFVLPIVSGVYDSTFILLWLCPLSNMRSKTRKKSSLVLLLKEKISCAHKCNIPLLLSDFDILLIYRADLACS